MAEKFIIKAQKRDSLGTSSSRRLRREGKVPVAVYGGGEDSFSLVAELGDLAAILRSDSGVNTVFTLDVESEGTNDVIFHDRQIDSMSGKLIHADLRRIAKGEKLELTIQLHFVGELVFGEDDEEGGVLSQAMREVKVLCIPSKIPEYIEVDISGITSEHPLHVSDLKTDEGVEIQEDPEAVVASVVFIKELDLEPTPEDEVDEPELVGEEGEEGAEGEGGEGETSDEG